MIGKTFPKNNHDPIQYALAADWCDKNHATIEDKGDYYEIIEIPAPTLKILKNQALTRAKTAFATLRDNIRWVGGYGYDCAPEDITNFMAAYTPLLVKGEGTTEYKVWFTKQTKGIVTLTLDEMTAVYTAVRASQLKAYAWYETIRTQLEGAQTEKDLAAILAEIDRTETNSTENIS